MGYATRGALTMIRYLIPALLVLTVLIALGDGFRDALRRSEGWEITWALLLWGTIFLWVGAIVLVGIRAELRGETTSDLGSEWDPDGVREAGIILAGGGGLLWLRGLDSGWMSFEHFGRTMERWIGPWTLDAIAVTMILTGLVLLATPTIWRMGRRLVKGDPHG